MPSKVGGVERDDHLVAHPRLDGVPTARAPVALGRLVRVHKADQDLLADRDLVAHRNAQMTRANVTASAAATSKTSDGRLRCAR
ncbi:MAG: hypothetical protein NVS3B21_17920 [Acidimicrobiales bacterium]